MPRRTCLRLLQTKPRYQLDFIFSLAGIKATSPARILTPLLAPTVDLLEVRKCSETGTTLLGYWRSRIRARSSRLSAVRQRHTCSRPAGCGSRLRHQRSPLCPAGTCYTSAGCRLASWYSRPSNIHSCQWARKRS
jgi:hypothetical protein